jgi:tRNA A-37 threonylcarbamoyl transferase component Bud32
MGSVYAATHVHLGKRFAIKVLSSTVSESRVSVERLKTEAVAASSIDHDNIISVVSFDEAQTGMVFIVMELLEGESLAELASRGPMPPAEAVEVLAPVAAALEAAHARGIVHRDLKPENIFLARRKGQVVPKVLDFGISKIRSDDAEKVRLTTTGQLVGTPLYMAPEQAKGEAVIDHRADIYALGALLYELVTGTPPFTGNNYFQLLWKHGNEVPERAALRAPAAQIPAALDQVIARALEKDPDARWQSMEAFRKAMLDAVNGGDAAAGVEPGAVRTTFAGARQSKGLTAAAIAGAVVVAALTAAALLTAGPAAEPVVRPKTTEPKASIPAEPAQKTEPVAVAPTLRTVRIESEPEGARVWVGGAALPSTTPTTVELPAEQRSVSLRLERAGYVPFAREETLPEDPAAAVRVSLRPRAKGKGSSGNGLIRKDY